MTKINPKFLYDEQGNKVGVLLPRKIYEKIMATVDDYEDLKTALKLSKKPTKKKTSKHLDL